MEVLRRVMPFGALTLPLTGGGPSAGRAAPATRRRGTESTV